MKIILIVVLLTLGYLYGMSKLDVMYKRELASIPTITEPGSNTLIEKEDEKPIILTIDVSGAVNKPGKYELESGERLETLINLAGGLKHNADLSTINLDVFVYETKTLYVPYDIGNTKLSINKGDINILSLLPGIGEAIAQRIIDYRTVYGDFGYLDEIKKVSGIGEATFTKIRELICL